ncbi:hypothetical protein M2459_001530 [Parabacteroides sp. PF5-5]|nr:MULTISPECIES: STM3941 family protein [unclassified Parabacteroides]MDH6322984.1 hypothetical protein [Parabacteroides sp. PH5-8]MDH6334786.1 hypothetical protein [Parabacteroides sp. PF5-5]MDH6384294.1 hypothetical protein [Parabacteroides sp. PH5-17]MDH6393412.1 hypothetical protein [Parabacteroides sp. PFB2-22]MDH6406562.1 hypothetical protein [Parabacteroides sp. PH5-26]
MIPSVITFTLKKKKTRLLYLGALLAVVFGSLELYLFSLLKYGAGKFILLCLVIVSCIYAIFCVASLIRLKKENFTGIYISDEGINDISTGNNYGSVLWQDVESVKIMDELGNPNRKYIVLKVHNPIDYIQREISLSKRRSLELKLQYYGSPICFSNRALNCTFDQLKDAVYVKYNHYKDMHPV